MAHRCISQLASVMLGYVDAENADEHLAKAESISIQEGGQRLKMNVGAVKAYHLMHRKRDFEGAKKYHLYNLKRAKRMGALRREAVTSENIGELELLLGNEEEAQIMFENAIRAGKSTWTLVVGASQGSIALIHARKGQIEEALSSLDESESIVRSSGNPSELAKFLARKAQVLHLSANDLGGQEAYQEAMTLTKGIQHPEVSLVCHLEEYRELPSVPLRQ